MPQKTSRAGKSKLAPPPAPPFHQLKRKSASTLFVLITIEIISNCEKPRRRALHLHKRKSVCDSPISRNSARLHRQNPTITHKYLYTDSYFLIIMFYRRIL